MGRKRAEPSEHLIRACARNREESRFRVNRRVRTTQHQSRGLYTHDDRVGILCEYGLANGDEEGRFFRTKGCRTIVHIYIYIFV